jgi:hypothetical protein
MRLISLLPKLAAVPLVALALTAGFAQGPLTPPSGPPGPTMKSLQQIEPRTGISALPFTISTSGSYYLIRNLRGASGENGITITADDVTLDLNGMSLIGVGGSLHGVSIDGGLSGVAIRNGTVRDWGAKGVDVALVTGGFSKSCGSPTTAIRVWPSGAMPSSTTASHAAMDF